MRGWRHKNTLNKQLADGHFSLHKSFLPRSLLCNMQQISGFMATPFVWLAINKYEAKLGQARRELVIDKGISSSHWRLAEMNHLAEDFSYAPAIKLLDCRQVRLLAARDDHFLGQSCHCCRFSSIHFRTTQRFSNINKFLVFQSGPTTRLDFSDVLIESDCWLSCMFTCFHDF